MEKREAPKVNARIFVIFVIGIILISVTGALIFRGGSEWVSIYNIIGLVFLVVIVPVIVKKKKWSVQKKIPDSRKGFMEAQKEIRNIKKEDMRISGLFRKHLEEEFEKLNKDQFRIKRRPKKELDRLNATWKILFLTGVFIIALTFLINQAQVNYEGYEIFTDFNYALYILGAFLLFWALFFWLVYRVKRIEYEKGHHVIRI